MRALFLTLAFALAGCDKAATIVQAQTGIPAQQEVGLTPQEVGELGSRGAALYQCAAYAFNSSKNYSDKAEPFLEKGQKLIAEFIIQAKNIKDDPAKLKQATEKVPIIILDNVGGPSPDFGSGRVWNAVELYVEDDLYDRSGWTHQKIIQNPKICQRN